VPEVGRGFRALEWRIAWRHLRAGERAPRWVNVLTIVAVFVLCIGLGFALYAASLGPEALEGEQLLSAGITTPYQRYYGVFGGGSMAAATMLMVFALYARFFNLLSTIITMSVLLGCMALVVVLSLMTGLEADLRDKILAQKAHIRVSAVEVKSRNGLIIEHQPNAMLRMVLDADLHARNRRAEALLGINPSASWLSLCEPRGSVLFVGLDRRDVLFRDPALGARLRDDRRCLDFDRL
jgi:hypothetical protein